MTIEELSKKTVMELRSYAKKNNIELFESKTKLEILEILATWIPPVKAQKVSEAEKNKKEKNSAAVYSTRNLHWNGVGEIKLGYNIVSQEEAERWVTHKAVRTATPEEVARHYGKA